MSIRDVVSAVESGLVEVCRADWLAMLKSIPKIADAELELWRTDLILGSENAAGHQFVTVEASKAKAMCELAATKPEKQPKE